MFNTEYRVIFFLFSILFYIFKKYYVLLNIIYIFCFFVLFFIILLIIYNIFYNFYINRNYKYLHRLWIKNIFKLDFIYYKNSNMLFNLCFRNIYIPPVNFNNLILFNNNKKLIYSLLKDIRLSIHSIYIIFYIWEPSFLSNKIALSLIKASSRGVDCRIILDSIGSLNFFKTIWPLIMQKHGIKIIEYSKFYFFEIFFKRIDFRQHKKIILIDNYITYVGSMNLVDYKKFKKHLNLGIWIDLMIKIKGDLVNKIIKLIFFYEWEIETGEVIPDVKTVYKNIKKSTTKLVQIINSSPGLPNNLIHCALLNIISSTKKRLIITTPYFVPSSLLINTICSIANKGIEVNIILSKKSDSFLVYWASRYFFKDLYLSNIKIYLYKDNFLHSKSILIDNNISILGSINFDIRSIWLNFEILLIIYNNHINKKLYKIHQQYITQSKLIDNSFFSKKKMYENFFEKFSYFFRSFL